MLASGIEESDSEIYIYMCVCVCVCVCVYLFFFKFFPHLGCYIILRRVPCAI